MNVFCFFYISLIISALPSLSSPLSPPLPPAPPFLFLAKLKNKPDQDLWKIGQENNKKKQFLQNIAA